LFQKRNNHNNRILRITIRLQKIKKKKKQSKLDKLAKFDLPLEAKQKLLENPQLLELSIDPRNDQIDKQSFNEAESIMQTQR